MREPSREVPLGIRTHANWCPWFVMYAEHGEQRLVVADVTLSEHNFDPHAAGHTGRFRVGLGPEECVAPDICEASDSHGHSRIYYAGDDFEEARQAFHRLEEMILRPSQ